MISIIIPTYNRPEMLKTALSSIQCNNLKLVDVIVCDDKSCEEKQIENAKVIEDIKLEKELNIQYLENSRSKGVSGARNCAIENAKGDWLLFLDDDDEFYDGYIDYIYDYLEHIHYNVDLVWSNVIIDNKIGLFENNIKRSFSINNEESLYSDFLSIGLGYGVLVKKSVFFECGMFDETLKVSEDTSFFIELIRRKKIIKNVPVFGVIIHNHCNEKLTSNYKYHADNNIFRDLFRKNIDVFKTYDSLYCSFSSWIIQVYKENRMYIKALKFCFEFLFKNLFSIKIIKQFCKEVRRLYN